MKRIANWWRENGLAVIILTGLMIFMAVIGIQAVKILTLEASLRAAEIEKTRLEFLVDELSELSD